MIRYRRTKRVIPHPRRDRRATPLAPGRIGREEISFKLWTGEILRVEVMTTDPDLKRFADLGGWASRDMGLYRWGDPQLISIRCTIGGPRKKKGKGAGNKATPDAADVREDAAKPAAPAGRPKPAKSSTRSARSS